MLTDEQIRDYEYPGVYREADRIRPGTAELPGCRVHRASASPRLRFSGACWAWIAMSALVTIYIAWRCWK